MCTYTCSRGLFKTTFSFRCLHLDMSIANRVPHDHIQLSCHDTGICWSWCIPFLCSTHSVILGIRSRNGPGTRCLGEATQWSESTGIEELENKRALPTKFPIAHNKTCPIHTYRILHSVMLGFSTQLCCSSCSLACFGILEFLTQSRKLWCLSTCLHLSLRKYVLCIN